MDITCSCNSVPSKIHPVIQKLLSDNFQSNRIHLSSFSDKFFTFISEENLDEKIKAGEIDPSHPNQLGNAYIAKVLLDKIWGIKFDPEKYIKNVNGGEKLPEY